MPAVKEENFHGIAVPLSLSFVSFFGSRLLAFFIFFKGGNRLLGWGHSMPAPLVRIEKGQIFLVCLVNSKSLNPPPGIGHDFCFLDIFFCFPSGLGYVENHLIYNGIRTKLHDLTMDYNP